MRMRVFYLVLSSGLVVCMENFQRKYFIWTPFHKRLLTKRPSQMVSNKKIQIKMLSPKMIQSEQI